ncbi:sugar isomerase domain-containing protein [Dryocola sp. BD613]|uniref:sugar isomerase domain-containing protein n=1 Tax=Dryocola sp. BD613 TaxID=3133272 RepID=UPI003F4FCC32
MSKATEDFLQAIRTRLDRLEGNGTSLEAAAALMADAAMDGRKLFVFGASHAGILTEELCYRAGGLAIVNPLFCAALMLNVRPLPLTSALENVEGLGRELVGASPVGEGDVVLVHSVSGRNAMPLDVALSAQARGARAIAITSLDTAGRVSPRHSSGKLLCEVADIVIDNLCDYGDAAISLPSLDQKVAPLSTIMAATIGNLLVIRISEIMLSRRQTPPVLASANIDGNQKINQDIFQRHHSQIHYLL